MMIDVTRPRRRPSDPEATPGDLRALARMIWPGDAPWQTAMGRVLDIDERRIRAFLASERAIPPGVIRDLVQLAAEAEAGRALAAIADGRVPIGHPAHLELSEWVATALAERLSTLLPR